MEEALYNRKDHPLGMARDFRVNSTVFLFDGELILSTSFCQYYTIFSSTGLLCHLPYPDILLLVMQLTHHTLVGETLQNNPIRSLSFAG